MSNVMDEEIERRMARRKSGLVLDFIQDKGTAATLPKTRDKLAIPAQKLTEEESSLSYCTVAEVTGHEREHGTAAVSAQGLANAQASNPVDVHVRGLAVGRSRTWTGTNGSLHLQRVSRQPIGPRAARGDRPDQLAA